MLVTVTCMRAIISFSWTSSVGEWVTSAGPAIPFGVFGALMGMLALFTIPISLGVSGLELLLLNGCRALLDHGDVIVYTLLGGCRRQ